MIFREFQFDLLEYKSVMITKKRVIPAWWVKSKWMEIIFPLNERAVWCETKQNKTKITIECRSFHVSYITTLTEKIEQKSKHKNRPIKRKNSKTK